MTSACTDRSEAETSNPSRHGCASKQRKRNIHRMFLFLCSKSARRGSNPRPPPWQGGAPPLSHSRIYMKYAPQKAKIKPFSILHTKAGDGNRTHVSSLEGWCSTIELHPHIKSAQNRNRTSDTRIFSPLLYQLSYLGSWL